MKAELKLSIVILVTILNHVNAAVEVVVGKEEIVIREGKEVNCEINSVLCVTIRKYYTNQSSCCFQKGIKQLDE